MNRVSVGMVFLLIGGLAVACHDGRQIVPTQPPSFQTTSDYNSLKAQIIALFPTGSVSLRNAALRHLRNIQSALADGNLPLAQNKMFNLVDYTLQKLHNGQLLDPNGSSPPTTDEAVCLLISGLYEFVSLVAPTTCAGGITEDGAAVVVGPAGGMVVTGNGHAGADIPAGTLSEPVLVTITRIPDPTGDPGTGPLNTDLNQYPRFYEITTSPAGAPLANDFVVGICVYDPPNPYAPPTLEIAGRLRLAHNVGTGIEFLPLVSAPFLSCDDTAMRDGEPLNFGSRMTLWVARLVGPRPLFAATVLSPGGLGGLAGGFSPFGAVDPGPAPDPDPPPPPDPDPLR